MKKALKLITLVGVLLSISSNSFGQCNARFTVEKISGYSDSYLFHDAGNNSQGTLHSKWNMGDNSYSNYSPSLNELHHYTRPGNYTVCRYTLDSGNLCRDTFCTSQQITVPACRSDFNMRFYGYTRDSLTLLYPVGKTRGDTYHWTIVSPSGTFSYVERVFTLKKQYFELGKHTITLTVTGTGCTESTTRVINLRPVFDCDASFDTVSQFAAAFGKGYHFYDNDSNVFDRTVISKFLWGDGDSSINTDYGRSSNHHVFVKPGTYNTCRMVNDTVAKCKDTVCKTITLNKADCSANFNYFTENLPDKKIRLTVKNYSKNGTMFTWKSDRHLTPWSRNREMWGEPPKTLWTSIHSLNDTLNVRYSVQDLFCADSIEKTIVLDSAKGCNAHFTIDLDTSQKFHIKLTNKSTKKASHEYLWHFGDGNSSTIRNPTHTYQTFGQFPTCLTISDSTLKCRSQFCDTLGMDSLGKRLKVNGFTVEVNEGVLGSNRTVISTQVLYPNPSTGVFLLDLGGLTTPTVIKVTNTSGKRIKIDPFVNDQKLLLDLRNEPDGLYWITLTSGSNVYSFKALKLTN